MVLRLLRPLECVKLSGARRLLFRFIESRLFNKIDLPSQVYIWLKHKRLSNFCLFSL